MPGRSLMYTRNSNDPRTVPCVTPDVTGDDEDVIENYLLGSPFEETLYPLKGASAYRVVV